MKKTGTFLFSMLFTGVLTVIFAISIGYATFIENDYGTVTAKILIYNARWFEALLILLCINLIGSIFVNKLFSRKKWPILFFHLAFIFILIGAAITRYYGYEGIMHIREGESSDYIISEETFIQMVVNDGNETSNDMREVIFSPYTANRFSESLVVNGKTIRINNLQYIPSAIETVVADPEGKPLVSITAVVDGGRPFAFNLGEGEKKKLTDRTVGFNVKGEKADIDLTLLNNSLYVTATDSVFVLEMGGQRSDAILPEVQSKIGTQTIYSVGNTQFVVNQFFQKGKVQIGYSPSQEGQHPDAVHTEIKVGDTSEDLIVYGKKGIVGESYTKTVGGIDVSVSYGSRKIELPFSIQLTDFQLERYPGSNSPSSFASEVVLKDEGLERPYRIYMNNILDRKSVV